MTIDEIHKLMKEGKLTQEKAVEYLSTRTKEEKLSMWRMLISDIDRIGQTVICDPEADKTLIEPDILTMVVAGYYVTQICAAFGDVLTLEQKKHVVCAASHIFMADANKLKGLIKKLSGIK